MNIRSKKGFVLPMVIFFVVLAALTSIGIYTSGYFVTKELRVEEVSYVKGYFICVAALRYTYVRLQEQLNFVGYSFTFDDTDLDYTKFKTNIGLTANEILTITIKEYYSGCGWNQGEYQVSATYSS